jgi:hypothetical protein
MFHRVIWYKFTDVSEVLASSIITASSFFGPKFVHGVFSQVPSTYESDRLLGCAYCLHHHGDDLAWSDPFLYLNLLLCAGLTHCPYDGASKHLLNVGKLLPDYTAQHPRKKSFSYSPL